MKKYPQLHLDNQVCFAVYSLQRRITQAYQPLLKPLGLTYPQYLVMLVLWQTLEEEAESSAWSPVSVTQLCQKLMLDTGTVTPLLKRMEHNGLLTRSRSQEDERVVLVSLTESGKQLREKAADIPVQMACRSGFDVHEALGLRDKIRSWLNSWR
ncbi:MarR family winged helix-turn-helix transcriptional regulator [Bacterioplanoides sp. SCSIO 12839]|uniref:MarR family winged helix-turn-helix transcriptional regulator n=1 Tax=Bacterioplanoides sp. SCSIO 12839 TaxID=2829569 RepID=UPI0021068EBA|nr:MarR family transcriptional regulator [Bacterioplanoides sp. SCSIO 12839]